VGGAGEIVRLPGTVCAGGLGPQQQGGASGVCEKGADENSVAGGLRKLRPSGRPNSNAAKFISALELIALLADREWLDKLTKTIGQLWK
jgi:hypothetical protein